MKLFTLIAFITKVSLSMCEESPEWSYDYGVAGILSPIDWALGYPVCAGVRQSPVDIVTKKATTLCRNGKENLPLSFSGSCPSYVLHVLPETFKWEAINSSCKVHLNGKNYSLLQFHMHAPSEHTINGKSLDGEIHFVHKEDGGDGLLVIGLFMKAAGVPSNNEPWIDSVWKSLESEKQASDEGEQHLDVQYSYAELLKEELVAHGVYNYPGSLTTPPCTESVNWWVVSSPVQVNKDGFANFKDNLRTLEGTDDGNGARPVQPLNGRTIVKY